MDYKKLLTRINISIAVAGIAFLILCSSILCNKPAQKFDRTTTDLLQKQIVQLKKQQDDLKIIEQQQQVQTMADKRRESILEEQFAFTKTNNQQILKQLIQNKNEKIKSNRSTTLND